ncbi:MAG TPA: hypothetical protein VHE55_15015 [Fimbriimonadaceae bacterium]|nr:hypothetical protein [Fimbriimonadaceae bacterium]
MKRDAILASLVLASLISITLEVPVWKPDKSAYGRTFAGYATFKKVSPIRIAGDVLSMQDRSVLWSDRDFKIEHPDGLHPINTDGG